jgi:hypothetical protein
MSSNKPHGCGRECGHSRTSPDTPERALASSAPTSGPCHPTGPENAPAAKGGNVATRADEPRPALAARSRPVTAALRRLLDEREAKGLATYGRSLTTWNGRPSPRDLVEEMIDGAQYALQWELERADLLEELDAVLSERDGFRRKMFAIANLLRTGQTEHAMRIAEEWAEGNPLPAALGDEE